MIACTIKTKEQLEPAPHPEQSWPLLPSIPTACLLDRNCRVNLDDSRLEAGAQQFEDWNSTSKSASTITTNFNARDSFITLQREIDSIYATGYKKAVKKAAELKEEDEKELNEQNRIDLSAGQLSSAKPKKLLPPTPEPYIKIMTDYGQSKNYLACQASFYSLEIARDLVDMEEAKKKAIIGALYIRYVEACLQPIPPNLAKRLALFWSTWPVRFHNKPLGFYCLGFDIDGTHIVTAKHCLVADAVLDRTALVNNTTMAPLPNSRISFADNLKITHEYHLSPVHEQLYENTFSTSNLSDDIAVVVLDKPRQINPLEISTHRSWDRIVTLTSFYPYEQFMQCVSERGGLPCNIANLIRIDSSPTCVTPIRQGDCILHGCQTRPGSSGGPILAVRNGEYSLIGVHTGSIDDLENAPCKLPLGETFPNYGIAIDSSKVFSRLWVP
jgi:hypothetical protein